MFAIDEAMLMLLIRAPLRDAAADTRLFFALFIDTPILLLFTEVDIRYERR